MTHPLLIFQHWCCSIYVLVTWGQTTNAQIWPQVFSALTPSVKQAQGRQAQCISLRCLKGFLRRKSVMWHHPIGAELTSYNPYPLCTRSARWAQEGYGDSDNDIHPKRQRSHQLQAGEIPPFIESPVMSRNTQLEHLARPGTQRIWVVTCDLSTNGVMPRHRFPQRNRLCSVIWLEQPSY